MNISEHFTLDELTRSSTATRLGIQNVPDVTQMANMQALCKNILEPLYEKWNNIIVLSCFRCPELNKAIGGSATSKHMEGLAVDFVIPIKAWTPLNVCEWVQDHFDYDQNIHEYGTWTHIGWAHTNRRKGQHNGELTCYRKDGHVIYEPGLNKING